MDESRNSSANGAAAIRAHCEQHGYADFVVDGGLDYLVRGWGQTVQSVVSGYRLTADDYLNDMDGRRILREVWPLASDELRQNYQDRLAEADRKFMQATDAVSECLWGAENEANYGYSLKDDWYYYRVPKLKDPDW
jgi:hypothetical protein